MSRKFVAALAVAGSAAGSYWYFSPYLALHSMKNAIQSSDADAFNSHVDYPSLRESVKGQFSAYIARQTEQVSSSSNAERAGMALGSMMALAFADKIVDAMVRPEMVMHAMARGELKPRAAGGTEASSAASTPPNWTLDRIGVNRVIVRVAEGKPMEDRLALVFDRSGFANWKLTEVRLPARDIGEWHLLNASGGEVATPRP